MKLCITSFPDGEVIPDQFAFGVPDKHNHVKLGQNKNPHVYWKDVPQDTRSLALICLDSDAPAKGTHVNKEHEVIAENEPRIDFFHWVLVDINPKLNEIKVGEASDGVTAKGKRVGKTHLGVTGINDYTKWFSEDPDMKGNYGGYDGPCPPWNDELPHRYYFRLYALNVDTLGFEGAFDGKKALEAMNGKIIAHSEWTGTYSLNPKIRKKLSKAEK